MYIYLCIQYVLERARTKISLDYNDYHATMKKKYVYILLNIVITTRVFVAAFNWEEAWQGANDMAIEGHFVSQTTWLEVEYENWSSDAPDNWQGDENCVITRSSGEWDDKNCNMVYHFICEIPVS